MKETKFILPKRLTVDSSDETHGRFIAEPFERGYGHTIGNSLRRVLLSSLEGAAITEVKIKGVQHEFSTLPDVVEDVIEIILNLRTLRFKLYSQGPENLILDVNKKGEVLAEDFKPNSNVEILNPKTKICTLDGKGKVAMKVKVLRGRGFQPVESMEKKNIPAGVIPVDAVFSPVRKVNYKVENARVERRTDYDRLILEVWTDGSIKPEEAIAYSSQILKSGVDVFLKPKEEEEETEELKVSREEKAKKETLESLLDLPISVIEFSVRALNCLQQARIKTIRDLIKQGSEKLLSYKNFGKKSLQEIQEKLKELGKPKGLELGLDLEIGKK